MTKYDDEHKNFELNYNYNNFDNRKNIFIIGNSYADDLLNLMYYNKELNNNYYFYTVVADEMGPNYQINCIRGFLEKNKKIFYKNLFSFFQTQYKNSDYIIFAERFNLWALPITALNLIKLLISLKKIKKNLLYF